MFKILPFVLGGCVVSTALLNASGRRVFLEIAVCEDDFAAVASLTYADNREEWLFCFQKNMPPHTEENSLEFRRACAEVQLALEGFCQYLKFDLNNVPQWLVDNGDAINKIVQSYLFPTEPDEFQISNSNVQLRKDVEGFYLNQNQTQFIVSAARFAKTQAGRFVVDRFLAENDMEIVKRDMTHMNIQDNEVFSHL